MQLRSSWLFLVVIYLGYSVGDLLGAAQKSGRNDPNKKEAEEKKKIEKIIANKNEKLLKPPKTKYNISRIVKPGEDGNKEGRNKNERGYQKSKNLKVEMSKKKQTPAKALAGKSPSVKAPPPPPKVAVQSKPRTKGPQAPPPPPAQIKKSRNPRLPEQAKKPSKKGKPEGKTPLNDELDTYNDADPYISTVASKKDSLKQKSPTKVQTTPPAVPKRQPQRREPQRQKPKQPAQSLPKVISQIQSVDNNGDDHDSTRSIVPSVMIASKAGGPTKRKIVEKPPAPPPPPPSSSRKYHANVQEMPKKPAILTASQRRQQQASPPKPSKANLALIRAQREQTKPAVISGKLRGGAILQTGLRRKFEDYDDESEDEFEVSDVKRRRLGRPAAAYQRTGKGIRRHGNQIRSESMSTSFEEVFKRRGAAVKKRAPAKIKKKTSRRKLPSTTEITDTSDIDTSIETRTTSDESRHKRKRRRGRLHVASKKDKRRKRLAKRGRRKMTTTTESYTETSEESETYQPRRRKGASKKRTLKGKKEYRRGRRGKKASRRHRTSSSDDISEASETSSATYVHRGRRRKR